MPQLKVHNVRFYKPEPNAIYCMALHEKDRKLAVSRSDATLEIWNINHTIFIERTIASISENFSIEGLAWSNQRLFSVGLHGLLIEYDLQQLNIKNRAAVTGEAAYCLDIKHNNAEIAIGTEQGYINIFKVTEDGALFEKFLDKQEGRIISIKYESTGEFLVSGGIDAIRIWNVKSGHAIHKMTTGRSEASRETIVWCLQITDDFTIISGDSRGKLTFWDGKVGAQIESYQSHRADILSICVSEDQKTLCCAGVDPTIVNYVRITVKEGSQKFVKSIERKIHEHDVRAMVLCNDKLYSSGADGYLACSYHPPKTLIKNPPLLQSPCACFSREGRLILLRHAKHIEIWSLGECADTNNSYRGIVDLKNEPKKLIYYKRTVKNYEDEESNEGIICAALSNDGKLMFVSTNSGSRLFELNYEEEKLQLLNVELESAEVPCLQAVFSPNNQQLIVAPNTGGLQIFKIKNHVLNVIQNIEFNSDDITDAVTYLKISNCSKYLVVADPQSNIVIYMLKQNEWTLYETLPQHRAPPTALAINSKLLNVVVAYSDNKVIEFSIRKKQFTDFSKYMTPFSKLSFIKNITFDARPDQDHIILLHDDSTIYVVNKNKVSSEQKTKKPKLTGETQSMNCSSIKKYKHLAHLEWLKDDEIVAVEVNPLSIIEQLPPAFEHGTFGQK